MQQTLVARRPIRGEMFIERATDKNSFSLQRSETSVDLTDHTETLRFAGARAIKLIALSIDISLLWSENELHLEVEFTYS